MPAKRGRGRYVLAAALLTLEAPILSVLAVGAPLSGALLAVRRAAQNVAHTVPAPAAPAPSSRPSGPGRAAKPTPFRPRKLKGARRDISDRVAGCKRDRAGGGLDVRLADAVDRGGGPARPRIGSHRGDRSGAAIGLGAGVPEELSAGPSRCSTEHALVMPPAGVAQLVEAVRQDLLDRDWAICVGVTDLPLYILMGVRSSRTSA